MTLDLAGLRKIKIPDFWREELDTSNNLHRKPGISSHRPNSPDQDCYVNDLTASSIREK